MKEGGGGNKLQVYWLRNSVGESAKVPHQWSGRDRCNKITGWKVQEQIKETNFNIAAYIVTAINWYGSPLFHVKQYKQEITTNFLDKLNIRKVINYITWKVEASLSHYLLLCCAWPDAQLASVLHLQRLPQKQSQSNQNKIMRKKVRTFSK